MKQREIIKVPCGLRYISEWPGFDFPKGPHIMNKTLTEELTQAKKSVKRCEDRLAEFNKTVGLKS